MDSTNFEIMQSELEDLNRFGFSLAFENQNAKVFACEEKRIVACILLTDYVPIAEFRDLFQSISSLVKEGDYEKFIFDKRSLRTFHQPSMEWYFIEWKLNMLRLGLKKHRKLLPDLDWFVKAVEIARKPLLQRFPKESLEIIDIQYCSSLEDAINQ